MSRFPALRSTLPVPALPVLMLFSLGLLLLGPPASSAGDDEGAYDSKELNFTVRPPADSVDWKPVKIDETAFPTLRVHYLSIFKDSGAYADVAVYAQKLPASMVKQKLENIGGKWKDAFEGSLENPHDRTTKLEQFAGVDAYLVDVHGIKGTDNHRITWILCKNGAYLYTIIINRAGEATKDEDVQEEIDSILGSFKFHEILKVEKAKGAVKDDAPQGPGGKEDKPKQPETPEIDPKLLLKEKVESEFWRLNFTKPEGLAAEPLTDISKANQIKWSYRGTRNTVVMGFRVYVWSLQYKKYSLDQLVEKRLEWWKTRVKDTKEPVLDKNFKDFPLAKKAYNLELLGRGLTNRTERWIYLLAECDNDRQYQIEIYTMGDTGDKEWGKAVEELIKSLKPQKK